MQMGKTNRKKGYCNITELTVAQLHFFTSPEKITQFKLKQQLTKAYSAGPTNILTCQNSSKLLGWNSVNL